MRLVLYTTASNTTAIAIATLLAAEIAMCGELSLLSANNVTAQMAGNMTGGAMRQ